MNGLYRHGFLLAPVDRTALLVAKALLEWETIDSDQINDIMAGRPPRPADRRPQNTTLEMLCARRVPTLRKNGTNSSVANTRPHSAWSISSST